MALQDNSNGRADLYKIDPRNIVIREGWNIRHETQEFLSGIETLAASIASEGVKQPLTVYLEKSADGVEIVYLVDGHRRLRATMMAIDSGAPIVSVPCIAEVRNANEGEKLLSMYTRNTGVPLTQLELAELFRRLEAFGWKQSVIATRTGFSAGAVSQILKINSLAPKMRQLVEDGSIAASTAVQVTREHKGDAVAVVTDALAKATAVSDERAARQATIAAERAERKAAAKPDSVPAEPKPPKTLKPVPAPKVTAAALPKDENKRLNKIKDLFLELADDGQSEFLRWARDTRGHAGKAA